MPNAKCIRRTGGSPSLEWLRADPLCQTGGFGSDGAAGVTQRKCGCWSQENDRTCLKQVEHCRYFMIHDDDFGRPDL